MKILVDTNIIIDALQGRKPWCHDAQSLIMLIAQEKINGYVTAKELTDIWYLAKQIHKNEENGQKKAKGYIEKLCKLFTILDTTGYDIENALAYDDKDFEDSVMISTAIRCGMDGIITRNTKDYLNHGITIYDLSEYKNLL